MARDGNSFECTEQNWPVFFFHICRRSLSTQTRIYSLKRKTKKEKTLRMTAWTLAGPTCQWSGREEVNATAGAWSQSVGPVDGWRRMVCERIRILNLRRFLRGIYEARQSRGTRHALNCTAPSDARFQIRGVTVGPPEWARRASVWTEQAVLLRTTRNKTDGRW